MWEFKLAIQEKIHKLIEILLLLAREPGTEACLV